MNNVADAALHEAERLCIAASLLFICYFCTIFFFRFVYCYHPAVFLVL